MPRRNICSNIRSVLDTIDYNDYIIEDSFMLFVDFYKAFENVSHKFMVEAIKCFGFGAQFLKEIQTLYKGCNNSVKLAYGTTPRFELVAKYDNVVLSLFRFLKLWLDILRMDSSKVL